MSDSYYESVTTKINAMRAQRKINNELQSKAFYK